MSFGHQESTSPLRSERGQIAIFIALIFQVLFVFFAMIVNIGLIVHDKINLQNSVDLAAYYGAQRQAEILNAIAHQNYQVRQAWKLLSFRVRVLGDLGYQNHPMSSEGAGIASDVSAFGSGGRTRSNHLPVICINHSMWGGLPQNLCSTSRISIPELPRVRVLAPFNPINILVRMQTEVLRGAVGQDCSRTGPLNFNMALRWARAYRSQIAQSKEIMRMYANNLSESSTDFKDIRGNTAKGGALKTLDSNLTRANAKSLKDSGETSFKFFNSLGGIERKQWLNEVPTYPLIFYANLWSTGSGGGCAGSPSLINGFKEENLPKGMSASNEYDIFRNEPQDVDNLFHSIYGVEKNPWAMAYVGVYAETKPRKPYLPFGEPITLKAKAFAKPFGGRIGPWYYTQWPQGSRRSDGSLEQRVDMVSPIPMDISGGTQSTSDSELEHGIPNYSRYPGDTLGLASLSALTAFRAKIQNLVKTKKGLKPGFYSATPSGNDGLAMAASGPGFEGLNEPLSMVQYNAPWIREIEIAAIAPDLFDTTYYSIDVDSFNNYTKHGLDGRIIPADKVPYDIGSLENKIVNVEQQIQVAQSYADTNAFWILKKPQHLLTGWAPSGAFQYNFPEAAFGKCGPNSKESVPGRCSAGGRVGYSVKIVSEDYLNSSNLPLGGAGVKGKLINPPPENF